MLDSSRIKEFKVMFRVNSKQSSQIFVKSYSNSTVRILERTILTKFYWCEEKFICNELLEWNFGI